MTTESDEAMNARLASIGQRTAGLRARGSYNDRVMQAVRAPSGASVFDNMLRASRAIMPVAVMAAALAVGWAWRTDRAADMALASGYDAVELQW